MIDVIEMLEKSKIFKKNEKIAVAVSGGRDSIALLHLLKMNEQRLGISVVCFNIDHLIRGKDSENDSNFVEKFSKKIGVPFFIKRVDAVEFAREKKLSLEQSARILRYAALFEMAKDVGVKKICVAHHKDDQAETVLMHIFRGSGLRGATGMDFVSSKSIVRPLLNVSRENVEKYVEENHLPFVEDSSNTDTKFTRNFLRHEILSRIKKIYPFVTNNLSDFAEVCKIDEEFIASQIPKDCIVPARDEVKILSKVKELHPALSSRVVRKAFEEIAGLVDIEQIHVKLVLDLFDLQVGRKLDMPMGLEVVRDYDGVVIIKKIERKPKQVFKFVPGFFIFEGFGSVGIEKFYEIPEFAEGVLFVDADKIGKNCVIRGRREGDVFAKLGSRSKNLNDYFIDKKIEGRKRDFVQVVACENIILAVLGYDISESVKIDSDTKNIYKISFRKEE